MVRALPFGMDGNQRELVTPYKFREWTERNMMSQEAFIRMNGHACPVCKSKGTATAHDESYDDGMFFVRMECSECDTRWTERYALAGYKVTAIRKERKGK